MSSVRRFLAAIEERRRRKDSHQHQSWRERLQSGDLLLGERRRQALPPVRSSPGAEPFRTPPAAGGTERPPAGSAFAHLFELNHKIRTVLRGKLINLLKGINLFQRGLAYE